MCQVQDDALHQHVPFPFHINQTKPSHKHGRVRRHVNLWPHHFKAHPEFEAAKVVQKVVAAKASTPPAVEYLLPKPSRGAPAVANGPQ